MLLYAVMRSSDGTADVALMAFVTCDPIDYISYEGISKEGEKTYFHTSQICATQTY